MPIALRKVSHSQNGASLDVINFPFSDDAERNGANKVPVFSQLGKTRLQLSNPTKERRREYRYSGSTKASFKQVSSSKVFKMVLRAGKKRQTETEKQRLINIFTETAGKALRWGRG